MAFKELKGCQIPGNENYLMNKGFFPLHPSLQRKSAVSSRDGFGQMEEAEVKSSVCGTEHRGVGGTSNLPGVRVGQEHSSP